MGRTFSALLFGLAIVLFPGSRLSGATGATTNALEMDDAYIRQDGGAWVIGTSLVRFAVGGNGAPAGVREIVEPTSGTVWHRNDAPDAFIGLNGQRLLIGGAGMTPDGADVQEWWGGVRLDLHYRVASAGVRITRSYAAYPGSSVVEMWTRVSGATRTTTLSDLNGLSLTVPNGRTHWVTGHIAPAEAGGKFTRAWSDLEDGRSLDLGSDRRASEQAMPWFAIESDGQQLFGALLWSGSWRFRAERHQDAMAVQIGLPAFTTTLAPGASAELPHAIFGITSAAAPDTAIALRRFVDAGLRRGRTLKPFVTYNTWFAYGTRFDEAAVLAEMEVAAAAGIEQFVIDAGWWINANTDDVGDYRMGWGSWTVDRERFPNGLAALTDRAHELGMRLGLWVEPERVDRATVGQPNLALERFLAMQDGRYDPERENGEAHSAQICLADTEAYNWVWRQLVTLIEDVRPDYLKWDNNFWINCNRLGHGHGTTDGNFRHHLALERMLQSLREQFAEMDIENCSAGGNRLSLGMLRYSDAGWMDDRTDPASHVRHNLQGLIGVMPAPYLMSFALSSEAEPMMDVEGNDVANIIRSRMSGAFGFSWHAYDMSEGTLAMVRREVDLFKMMRPILQDSAALLLGAQVPAAGGPEGGWDVVQHLNSRSGDAVLMAYDARSGGDAVLVHPRGLKAEARYALESADFGPAGESSGADLMTHGVEIRASALSRAHILILRVVGTP